MSSAVCLHLDQSKILLSGNGLANLLTVINLAGTKYIMPNNACVLNRSTSGLT